MPSKSGSTSKTKKNATSKPRTRKKAVVMSEEAIHEAIAEEAYYIAMARGFDGGDPVGDWLQAEETVTARLGI